ncbi:urease accessory protein UreD [Paraburkholderia sp. BCC1886]|uniref:urease accessory protein UreD n=1 Tax=Paraburkholderia sp. BCC1886 TaxID=2562670 RepID=UPI001182D59E|nr:urease accessory protein UreD [Paraburkholderia sp. BCC1886]
MRIDTLPAGAGLCEPQLDLCFTRAPSGATYLSRQRAGYPYHVGRLLTAGGSGEDARVIVQSSSGGLFEDDDVGQHVVATAGARARVETAAATIVHSMTRGFAHSRVRIEAQEDARLDWLPHPSILFPGARLTSRIDAVLHPGARILLADSYTSHDPAEQGTPFGALDAGIAVRDANGRLLARDRFRLDGASARPLGGVSAQFAAHGGLMVLTLDNEEAKAAVGSLEHATVDAFYAGASLLPGGCGAFLRVLAPDSLSLRTALDRAIDAVRAVSV